jgi:hypothetical protein
MGVNETIGRRTAGNVWRLPFFALVTKYGPKAFVVAAAS